MKGNMNKNDYDLDELIMDILTHQHNLRLCPELRPKKKSKFWKTIKWIFTGVK